MIIDKEMLIKEQKFVTQLISYSIFSFVGIGFFVLSILIGNESLDFVNLFFNALISIVPFGYFMGIRRIIPVVRLWKKVNNDDFIIVEMQIYEKYVFNRKTEGRDSLLVFGEEEDNVFLRFSDRKKYKEGDICYRFYTINAKGKKEYFALYNKSKYNLDKELQRLIDISFVQKPIEEKYREKDM